MDFKYVCLLVAFVSCTFFMAVESKSRKSKCLNSDGQLKCKDNQRCMDKGKNLCEYPYLGKGCKCKKVKGCWTSNLQLGCDYGLICMSKKSICLENNYKSKKCSCVKGCRVASGRDFVAIRENESVAIRSLCKLCMCRAVGYDMKEYCRPLYGCNVVANMLGG